MWLTCLRLNLAGVLKIKINWNLIGMSLGCKLQLRVTGYYKGCDKIGQQSFKDQGFGIM